MLFWRYQESNSFSAILFNFGFIVALKNYFFITILIILILKMLSPFRSVTVHILELAHFIYIKNFLASLFL